MTQLQSQATGAPDYLDDTFDVRSQLTPIQTRDWVAQEGYLSRYDGDVGSGLLSGVTPCRRTVERWRDKDYLGFGRRLAEAHEAYVDSIESVHTYVIRKIGEMADPHRANPLWLFGKLNAERPDKYRPSATPPDDAARAAAGALVALGQVMRQRLAADSPQPQPLVLGAPLPSPAAAAAAAAAPLPSPAPAHEAPNPPAGLGRDSQEE